MSTDLKLTAADYDRMVSKGAFDELPQRIELIYGVIKSMNPAGPIHDDIIEFLNRWSMRNTDENSVGVRVQSGLDLPEFDSRPEPDIAWVKAGRYLAGHPRAEHVWLLIEVSESSLQFDKATKAELYAKASIPEYWIVDVNAKEVCVHLRPEHDRYTAISTFGARDKLAPQILPAAELDLSKLFDGITEEP